MTDAPLGFWRIATDQPDRPALYADADGQTYTFGDLHARANQVANGLRAMGLTAGDTVAVALPNTVQYFEVVLGCVQIGLYCTPINWHLVGPEIAYIVDDTEAKVAIVHERFAEAVTAAGAEIDKSEVRLPEGALRDLGEYEIAIQVHGDVMAAVAIAVIPEE